MSGLVPIFQDHGILLTGANGFLGKILLAAFLDRFPHAARLHVLVRPRGNLSALERFEQEVLGSPPLQPLLKKLGRSCILERVQVLSGDASRPMAGLTADQLHALEDQVSLVLNCAGLVEFFPPLDRSLRANVETVERLLDLCRRIDSRLVHVSTCYVAGEGDGLVEETEPIPGFYPRRSGPDDNTFRVGEELAATRAAVKVAARGHEGAARSRSLTELGRLRATRWGWVNTYTYTKSVAEQVLAEQDDVPWTIVRPAIVESSLRYPFPGWIEGGRTAAPLVLMALGGLLDWPVRRDLSLEIVPVDLVASATLAVSGALLTGRARNVYHLASSDRNPYPLEDLVRLLCAAARSGTGRVPAPPIWLDPIPRLRFLDSRAADRRRQSQRRRIAQVRGLLQRVGLHRRLAGLRTLELQLRIREETFSQYTPFTVDNRYVFEAVNIRDLYSEMDSADTEALPWDPETIDWPAYWRDCQIPGIRKWVQPEAVRKWMIQL